MEFVQAAWLRSNSYALLPNCANRERRLRPDGSRMPDAASAPEFVFRQADAKDADVIVHFNKAMAKETEQLDLAEDTLQAGVLSVLKDASKGTYHVVEHRRRGLFRKLYNHVRQLAEAQQAGGLRLYADTTNTKAHSTYEALGMTSHYKVFEDMF